MAIRKINRKNVVRRRRPKMIARKNARNQNAVAKIYKAPYTYNQIPRVQKLRYAEYFTLSTGVGTTAQYAFRANGCHDPNYSGVGHQPMKWDQMKIFFNHYVVIGSKITIRHLGGSSATGVGYVAGIHLDDDNVIPGGGDLRYVIEQGKTQFKHINQAADVRTVLTQKFSCKKFFNIKDVKDNLSRVGAAVTADPTEQCLFNFWIASEDGTTTSNGGNFLAVIDYIVLFSEPSDVAAS